VQYVGQGQDKTARPAFYSRLFLGTLQRLALSQEPAGCSPLSEMHGRYNIPFAKIIKLNVGDRKLFCPALLHNNADAARLQPPSSKGSTVSDQVQHDQLHQEGLSRGVQTYGGLGTGQQSTESLNKVDDDMLSPSKKRKRIECFTEGPERQGRQDRGLTPVLSGLMER
jgi:hypothetical protein